MTRPLVSIVVILALSNVATSAAAPPTREASLKVVQDVPADVQAELDLTWSRFLDHFGSRRGCFDDVSVVLVPQVRGGDARYVIDERLIEIQIPTTPARFRESFAHELAHHVEHTCPEFVELKAVLQPRLGGLYGAWSSGAVWEEIPSELWAEGVVQLVNGVRILHADDMPVDASVIRLIEAWARSEGSRSISKLRGPRQPGSRAWHWSGRLR